MAQTHWTIDTAHSAIAFAVRHMVISKVRGRFARWEGTIALDEQEPGRSGVDVRIEADSIETGVADRDAHLRSADFLDVEHFPQLTFKSTRVESAGEQRFRVAGELTVRGVTREVVLDVAYAGQAKDPWGSTRAGFTATASLDRKDFGMQFNQVLETGGVLVGDKVEIELEIEAVQQQAASTAA